MIVLRTVIDFIRLPNVLGRLIVLLFQSVWLKSWREGGVVLDITGSRWSGVGCVVEKQCTWFCSADCRVTTCLENLEMSGNYTDVREMSGISLKVMEMSGNCRGKKSCHGKLCDFYNFPL